MLNSDCSRRQSVTQGLLPFHPWEWQPVVETPVQGEARTGQQEVQMRGACLDTPIPLMSFIPFSLSSPADAAGSDGA